MTITKIKKRDGTVVDFQKEKIRIAMEKAARAVNPNADLRPFDVMTDHAVRHIQIKFKDNLPDVESVQDLVERTLMEYGLFDVAKAYILYRAEHAKIRKEKVTEAEDQKRKPKLHYINEEGEKKVLDRRKLKARFAEAAEGLDEAVDIEALVEHCEGNLYDGIKAEEFGQAVVLTARAFIEKDPDYSTLATRLAMQNLYAEVFGVTTTAKRDHAYRQAFITNIKSCVETKRLVPEILEFDLETLASYLDLSRDDNFEYLGFQVLYDRYFIREEGGERKLETPQAFWMRVAMGLAMGEPKDKEKWAKAFYDAMSTLRYVPSTPTLFHAGTTYAQLSSCYLNTVDDDLENIFKVFGDNAQLSKYSGGIGTDWTNVRGTGALIKSTNVGSQGVIPFLKIANDVTVAINRSGKRRGATVAYLECWHYDYEDFLDLRRNTGDERRRTHDMNTASWIPDLFMKRVIENGEWTLFSPDETPELHHIYGQEFEKKYTEYEKKAKAGKIRLFKSLQAKDLWRKMITMMFETGHPWMTFKDPSNVRSPQDHVGVVHNSNLCTEITLNNSKDETAVCNLGSINMARHMRSGKIDLALLKDTTTTAVRMLDNVIDINYYPTIEAKNSNLKHRPVGLGIMGFQDALYLADIDFDSDKAVKFADESMEFIAYHTILTSSHLAKERGTYDTYKGSKWHKGIFPLDTLDLLEEQRGMPIGVVRSHKLDWTPVYESVKKYGMRNSNTMATAPTATISNISGCFPCIEPIYKNLYVKSNMSGEFTVVNKYLVTDLKRLGLWNETMLEELKRSDGSVQEITSIPPKLRGKYKEVFEIGPEWLVKIAAYRGKWMDQSQSLNIFIQGTSGRRLSDVYMLAWHLGLKTTYYLRSLGATSIEKSTIDINKTVSEGGATQSIAESLIINTVEVSPPTASDPLPVVEEVAVQATVETSLTTTEPSMGEEPVVMPTGKACLINDPDCEACQ